jgi:hypothetical protein
MGHLVLALWLLTQPSPDVAAMVARNLLIDSRPSQAAYMIPDHLRADPLVEHVERWGRGRLVEGIFARRRGRCADDPDAHAATPDQGGAGKIAAVVFSGS